MTKPILEAAAASAKEYVRKKENVDGVLNWKQRAKGEADFKAMHSITKKDEGELDGVDVEENKGVKKDKPLKNASSVNQPKEGMKNAKKTLKQFINQGGYGKSSYRNADKTDGEKSLKKTSDGVTKVIESEELEERFAGKEPSMNKNSKSFTFGTMILDDESQIKLSEEDAKTLNLLVKSLDDSNKKKLFRTFSKDLKTAKNVLKFAKTTMGAE